MANEANLETLTSLGGKMLVFLGRPAVQMQLVAIALALVLAWLLSKLLWRVLRRRIAIAPAENVSKRRRRLQRYGPMLLGYLLFPLLGLLSVIAAKKLIDSSGGFTGLTILALSLLVDFAIYRALLAVLYVLFPRKVVQRYHYRLLVPLFALYILAWILGRLIDLRHLAQVVLFEMPEGALTLGALCFATIGLYLWVETVLGANEAIFRLATRYTAIDPGPFEASLTLIRYLLIVVGAFVAFKSLGLNATTIAAITGGLSVGIGFGLREILSNFVSGVILLFEGSLRPGDIVHIDDEISIVKRLSIRSTTVRTLNNVEKIIPNQVFVTDSVTTYTGSDRSVRLQLPVGASYNDDPEAVIEILLAVAQAYPVVLTEPPPEVRLIGFGDSSVDFELAVWLDNPLLIPRVTSDLNRAIWQAFAQHNIEIPFPQRDLHLRSGIDWPQLRANPSN